MVGQNPPSRPLRVTVPFADRPFPECPSLFNGTMMTGARAACITDTTSSLKYQERAAPEARLVVGETDSAVDRRAVPAHPLPCGHLCFGDPPNRSAPESQKTSAAIGVVFAGAVSSACGLRAAPPPAAIL
jgi:hypothetical protein